VVSINETDLLTTCVHHSELQLVTALSLTSTIHRSPQHLLSLFPACCLQQPFPSNGFWQWRYSFPGSRRYCPANIPKLNSHSSTTTFHSTELHSAGLGSSLYSLGVDPTENTSSNNPSIVVRGGCLARDGILLTCLPNVTKQRIFLLAIVA
jgi:hypothetical protein